MLRNRERFPNSTEAFLTMLDGLRKRLNSAMVVMIPETSQDGHTTKAQPVLKGTVQQQDGTFMQVALPALEDMPIVYHGGGGITTTHPVAKGDEGLLIGVSRGFDPWHQQGGSQPPIDTRVQSLSDHAYLGGVRSDPRKIAGVSQVSGQHRSDDGKHFHDVHPQNGLTSQSANMVLHQVGDQVSHLLTTSGIKSNAVKILLNC